MSHKDLVSKLPNEKRYGIEWFEKGTTICGSMYANDLPSKSPIAMIDIDGTIIRPKDGRKLPRQGDVDDWEWAFPEVPEQLKKLSKKYRIVLISNQKRMHKAWPEKINKVVMKLGILLTIYAATADDQYRKPRTGLASLLTQSGKLPKDSIFCGDAAGRPGDFADTDRKFAMNLGIDFYTPEQLFQGGKAQKYNIKYPIMKDIIVAKSFYLGNLLAGWSDTKPTLHLMVGLPGSGKSWYAKYFFETRGCVRINTDIIGTIPKSLKAAEACMQVTVDADRIFGGIDKQHIVVDNTSLDKVTRGKWITLAKKHGYRVVCYDMQTDFDICRHNLAYRCVTGGRNVPEHVLRILRSKYVPPTKSEGLAAVFKVDFSPVGISKENINEYCKFMY